MSSKQSKIFRFELKQTEIQSVSVVFQFVLRNQTFFSVCFGVSHRKTTETNRIFSKQTEKISKKRSLLGGPRNRQFLFSVRTETNRNSICFSCLLVCFFAKPKIFFFNLFQFLSMFRTGIETTKTNRTYGMGNKMVDISANLLLFRLVFCLFWLFRTPKLPVSILKRNNRNKRLVSDSAETSFGSSFGCFDTKLVSEDTLFQTISCSDININYIGSVTTTVYISVRQIGRSVPAPIVYIRNIVSVTRTVYTSAGVYQLPLYITVCISSGVFQLQSSEEQ